MTERTLRGLIAEDEGMTALLLKRVLTAIGYNIMAIARNAEEVITLAQQVQPDFIVMDMNLPGMMGLDATRYILSGRRVPIIMLTPADTPEQREVARKLGASGCVVKPITCAEVSKAIGVGIAIFEQSGKGGAISAN